MMRGDIGQEVRAAVDPHPRALERRERRLGRRPHARIDGRAGELGERQKPAFPERPGVASQRHLGACLGEHGEILRVTGEGPGDAQRAVGGGDEALAP